MIVVFSLKRDNGIKRSDKYKDDSVVYFDKAQQISETVLNIFCDCQLPFEIF